MPRQKRPDCPDATSAGVRSRRHRCSTPTRRWRPPSWPSVCDRSADHASATCSSTSASRLGITVDDYLAAYDDQDQAQPFAGVDRPWWPGWTRWAVCSNKHAAVGSGRAGPPGLDPRAGPVQRRLRRPQAARPGAGRPRPGRLTRSSSWATPPTIGLRGRGGRAASPWPAGTRGSSSASAWRDDLVLDQPVRTCWTGCRRARTDSVGVDRGPRNARPTRLQVSRARAPALGLGLRPPSGALGLDDLSGRLVGPAARLGGRGLRRRRIGSVVVPAHRLDDQLGTSATGHVLDDRDRARLDDRLRLTDREAASGRPARSCDRRLGAAAAGHSGRSGGGAGHRAWGRAAGGTTTAGGLAAASMPNSGRDLREAAAELAHHRGQQGVARLGRHALGRRRPRARASRPGRRAPWRSGRGAVSAVSEALAASAKRDDRSEGRGAPALGGRELRRRARTARPSPSVWAISANQAACSCSTRRASASRRLLGQLAVTVVRERRLVGGHHH